MLSPSCTFGTFGTGSFVSLPKKDPVPNVPLVLFYLFFQKNKILFSHCIKKIKL